MAFRPLYTLSGAPPLCLGYGIAASEAWDRGDVLALNSAGALAEAASAAVDVYGVAAEGVTSGAALGPLTTVALVFPFTSDVVWAVNEAAEATQAPVTTDIGTIRDLVLSSGDWGIAASASGTSATPQFRVIDIDTVRNEWHVIVAPLELADVFQWHDAAV